MKRAKTVTGLLFQLLRTRWNGLSSPAKAFAIAGLIIAAAFALKASCLLGGGCQAASRPCQMRAPCQSAAMVAPAAPAQASGVQPASDVSDVPPCHR
jgi:hypothetical protein